MLCQMKEYLLEEYWDYIFNQDLDAITPDAKSLPGSEL